MKAIKENSIIKVLKDIPKLYNNIPYYHKLTAERHLEDGWQTVTKPETIQDVNYLSGIKEDAEGVFYYDVVDYTSEEIESRNNNEVLRIVSYLNTVVSSSRLYAKAIVMGKNVSDDLDYFKDVYTSKYNMCKVSDFDVFLELESDAEGFPTLDEYKEHVISRFEAGQAFFEQAKAMLEVFRKIVLSHTENGELEQAKNKIQAVDDLPDTLSPADFGAAFQYILFS